MNKAQKTADEIRQDAAMDDHLASLLAQSKAAFAGFQKSIADIDKSTIGDWYGMPPRMQADGWMFYRCGMKKDAAAAATRFLFGQHGWVDAPAGTAYRGCEGLDAAGGGGVYVCCPPEVYGRMKEVERKAMSKVGRKEIRESLTAELSAMGATIDDDGTSVTSSEISGEEFESIANGGSRPQRKRA